MVKHTKKRWKITISSEQNELQMATFNSDVELPEVPESKLNIPPFIVRFSTESATFNECPHVFLK